MCNCVCYKDEEGRGYEFSSITDQAKNLNYHLVDQNRIDIISLALSRSIISVIQFTEFKKALLKV